MRTSAESTLARRPDEFVPQFAERKSRRERDQFDPIAAFDATVLSQRVLKKSPEHIQSAATDLPIRRVDMRDGDDVSVDRADDDQHFASGAVVGRKQLAIRVHQVNLIIAGAIEFRPDDIEKIVWLIGPAGV